MFVANDNSTVVVDIGTETFKIGYSNNGIPSRFRSSCTVKNNFKSPVQDSVVVDFTNYMKILKDNVPEDTSYLCIAENTFEPPETKKNILECVMEENLCDSLLFARSGVLDAFSYGRASSLVLSIGGGSSQVCAVVEGVIVGRKKVKLNCNDLSRRFIEGKTPGSTPYDNFMSIEGGRILKEELYDQYKNFRSTRCSENDVHEVEEKFKSTHSDVFDLALSIKDLIDTLGDEHKTLLLSNIVITGAGSTIPYLGAELENRINEYFRQYKTRIFVRESRFHTFFGGVVYSNIGSTKLLHIGRADYQEHGLSILERKNYVWNN